MQARGGDWRSLPDKFRIRAKGQRTAAQDVLMQRILGDGAQDLQAQVLLQGCKAHWHSSPLSSSCGNIHAGRRPPVPNIRLP